MTRFADVKNDVAFRKIFGNEHKTVILISFLNAVLKLEENARIEELQIVNPYQLPRIAGEKSSIIDVRVKDKKGHSYIVEMQVANVEGFGKRVQYYTCREYSMQINTGDDYPLLKPAHFVGIMDFNYFKGNDYLSNHLILNGKTFAHELKEISFTFIELKKFKKELHELENIIEQWVYFIKNAKKQREIPENTGDEGLREAYKEADKFAWNKNQLTEYDNAFIAKQDEIGRITAAEKQATVKALKKGEEQKTYKVIERCIEKKMYVEDIAEITELTIEEVSTIIEEINSNKK